MKKNEAKSKRRKAARRRWFIFQGGGKVRKEYFRSEGVARDFLRSIGLDEHKFQFLKRPVS